MMRSIEQLLIVHEGFREKPYLDTVGKLSIGIGRNLDDCGINRDEAEYMMRNDIRTAIEELEKNLPWFRKLDEVRQAVLIDMAFNLGWPRLSQFIKTLEYIKEGDYEAASDEMLNSKWASQVKSRSLRLSKMMETGLWPNQ